MKEAIRFVRQWWWAFVAVAAGVFAVAWRFMAMRGGDASKPEPSVVPSLAERARSEVERVRLEGEVEKARATTKAEAAHQTLNQIEEEAKADPVAARRKLASWMQGNL
jgi:DNA-binding XRE family transcriptional regulator